MSEELAKERVKQQFGQSARDYAVSDVHASGESLRLLIDLTRPRAEWTTVDVATGAGHTAMAFAPHVSRVIATDLTPAMLEVTRELAAARQLDNVETQLADAESLPFPDNSIDLVTCRLAMHHFPRREQAIAGFYRVLKPGGYFGLTDNITLDDDEAAAEYNAIEIARDPSHLEVLSLESLTEKLIAAGFKIDATRTLTKEFELNDWADRQKVTAEGKEGLRRMFRGMSDKLKILMKPREADGTIYFTLWEAVLVAHKPAKAPWACR